MPKHLITVPLLVLEDKTEDVVLLLRRPPVVSKFNINGDVGNIQKPKKKKQDADQKLKNKGALKWQMKMPDYSKPHEREAALRHCKQTRVLQISDARGIDLVQVLRDQSPNVLVLQRLADAKAAIESVHCALVISDLFLFPPDSQYEDLSEKDRLDEIRTPSGWQFVVAIRGGTESRPTAPTVPLVVVTYFWDQPCFRQRRTAYEQAFPNSPVALVPKYYKVDYGDAHFNSPRPEDQIFEHVLDSISKQNPDYLRSHLPALFGFLATSLSHQQAQCEFYEAVKDLRRSYSELSRIFLDFTLVLDCSFAARADEILRTGSLSFDLASTDVSIFDDTTFRFEIRHPRSNQLAAGELMSFPQRGPEYPQHLLEFLVLLAIASYTYALPYDHGNLLNEKQLRSLIKPVFDDNNVAMPSRKKAEDVISHAIRKIRESIDTSLKVKKFSIFTATDHILPDYEHKGYFLNGRFEVRRERRVRRSPRRTLGNV